MGVLRVVARAPLLILLATCQVDKLTNNPPPVATLSLAPAEVRDSAAVGSTAMDGDSLAVINTGPGTLSWSARLAMGGSWLGLVGPTNGTAPAKLRLAFNPAGLPTGVYRDTVVVSAENASASPGRVPVEFMVHPCRPVPIVLNAQLTDSLTTWDCGAPHRANSFARVYSFAANANDSISITMSSTAVDAYLVLDSSATETAPPVVLNDTCVAAGAAHDACVRYQRLTAAGTYRIEATSAGVGQTGKFTLSVTRPSAPTGPASLVQLRSDSSTAIPLGGSTDQASVVLRGVMADPDPGDSLRLEVEVRPAGSAFTNAPTQTGGRVANGQNGFVAVPGLANNTGYHWQARAADQTGRTSAWTAFDGNPNSPPDFSTSVPVPPAPPSALGQFQSDGTTSIPVGGTAPSRLVFFKAGVTDANPGDSLRLEVEVRPVGTSFTNKATGSGTVVRNDTTATASNAVALSDNTAYHWQARTVDQTGRTSGWVAFGGNGESATDFRVTVAVTQIVFTGQPSNAVAGTAISPAVRVSAQDALGNTLSSFTGNVTVSLVSNPGGDTLSGTKTVAAQNGVATFADLSIARVGAGYTLQAAASKLSDTSAAFTITPAAAKRLVFTVQPTTAPAGAAISPAVQVTARDSFGNTATGFADSVFAAIGVNPGGGVLAGTVRRTAVAGVATFADLTIDKAGAGYTLVASGTGITNGTSAAFTITAATAGKLGITTQPPTAAQSGVPLSQAPVLQIRDANGNPVSQAGVAVTASATPSAGSLASATATSDANGRATFTGLALSGPVGSYTLSFAASGLAPVTSNAITLSAGPASGVAIVTQPSPAAQSGVAFAQQPVVQLRDGAGNPVSQVGVTVTATIATGTGTLGGTATAVTNASGVASFTSLAISGPTGSYTLSFGATGLTPAVSGTITIGSGAATQLTLTTQPSAAAQSGAAFAQQPVLQLRDGAGNSVSQAGVTVTATIATGTGTLGGTVTAVTNASGVASFADLSISGTAGNYTLSFSATGLTAAVSGPITLSAGAATQLTLTTQPSAAAQSGVAFAQQPVLQLRDGAGNAVGQAGVTVTTTIATGTGTLGGTVTAATNANGVASFAGLSISGTAGNYTLSFGAAGLTPAVSGPITVSAGATTHLTLTTQPSTTAQSGVAFAQQPVLQLRDGAGNPVSQAGVSVTATIATGTGTLGGTATVATTASGVASFADLSISATAGSYTLSFGAPGLTPAVSGPITIGAGTATQLAITTQPPTTAQSGVAFAQQPVVQLRDGAGNLVNQAGVTVTAAIAAGGGTLGGTLTATTNASGVASFTDLAISGTIGDRTLSFSATGLTQVVSGIITLSAGTATQLTLTTQPSAAAQSGVAFAQQPAVQLRDASGNAVSQSGVTVTAVIATGGGTLGGTTTATTTASGTASFTNLAISGAAGDRTLRFSAAGLTPAVSGTITVGAGAPTQLALTTQPSTAAQSGVAFAQQPVVQLRDGAGNPVNQVGVTVTAAITTGGGTLGGTATATTNASGVASFANLSISGTIGERTLSFSAPSFVSVTSGPITLSAGAASELTVTTQPSATAQSGAAFAQQPVVQLRDGAGNAVSQAGVTVTAAIASGVGTLGGTATATTNASGVASFANLSISGTVGERTLSFGAAGLTPAASGPIAVSAGAATQLTLTTQPSAAAQSGVAFAQQPVLQLRDGAGNAVGQAGVTVTATIATGTGTLGGTVTAATNANGVASFAGLSISGTAGNYTLSFGAAGLTPAVSGPITVSAGAATQLALTTQPSATAQSGVAFAQQPVLQLRDGAGNAVSQAGVTVTAAIATGGGTLGGTATATTNASGVATFTNLSISGAAGGRTLSLSATGLTPAVSGTITVGAGAATQLTVTTQPSAAAQSGVAFAQQPLLQLRDGAGNPVSQAGVTVTAAIATGGGTLGGTATAATSPAGVATFTNLSISGPAGGYTLSFGATGLTPAVSGTITLGAGSAGRLVITTEPSTSVQNDVAFPQQPVVQLQDAAGNPVATSGTVVTAAIASGGGTLGGTPTATTNAAGAAVFTDLKITGTVGGRTLSFTSGSLAGATSSTVTVVPGAATQIAANAGNHESAPAGTAVATPPTVVVRDVSNNPVAGVAVTFAVPGTSNGSLTSPSQITNGGGIARVGGWTLSTTPKPDTMTAVSTGLTGSPVTFVDTAKVGAPAQITKFSGDVVGPVNTTTVHDVLLTDATNNPVPGVTVTWVARGGGSVSPTTSSTDAGGHAQATRTLGLTPGSETTTAKATLTGGLDSVTFNITAQVGGATRMTANGGDAQTDTVGQTLPTPLSVRVTDDLNNPVSNVTISWVVSDGGGSVSAPTSVTNGSGIASINWTLGTRMSPIDSTQSARASGVGSAVTFQAYTVPGAVSAAQTSVTATSPITASTGSGASTVTVTARDQFGNVIKGKTVTLGATGTANIVTNPAPTDVNGVATGTLSSTRAESKTVSAAVDGVAISQQPSVVVNPAAASNLSYLVQPSDAAAGATITPAVQVEIRDQFNNRVTGATNGVALTIQTNAGGGTLTGGGTVTAASGVATFAGLSIDRAGAGYTLAASSGGLTGATSPAFTITPSSVSAAQSTVTTTSPIVASNGSSQSTITVTARDQFGNPIQGAAVTLGVSPSTGGTLTQPVGTTNPSGVATGSFSSTVAGSRTVSATINAVGVTQTATVVVNPGPVSAAQSTVSATSPITAGSGTSTITVTARDQFGNPIQGATVTLAASPTSGNTLTQPLGTTDASGVVTGTLSSTVAETKTVSSTISSVAITQTTTVVVNAGTVSATQSTVSATSPITAGSGTSTITVTARDANGNPIPGATVALAATPTTGNTLTQPVGTTNASGVATGTLSSAAAESKTVSATINSVAISQTATVVVNPGTVSAAQSTVTASSPITAGSGPSTITVTARDASGNPIQGAAVVLGVTPTTGNTLTQPVGTTDANGVATGTLSSTSAQTKTVSATINSVAITQTATVLVNPAAVSAAQSTVTATSPIAAGTGTSTITVTALDGFGNPIQGATVVLAATGSGNTLTQPGGPTNANGVATGTLSSLVAQSKTVSATINAVGITQTATVVVTASTVSGAQSSVAATSPITAGSETSTITVTARDELGNAVSGATVILSATGTGNTLTQPSATTNSSGVATGTLSSTVAESKTVSATINGVAVTQTASVVVHAGPASKLALTTLPSSGAQSGAALVQQPVVQLQDANGNAVSQAAVPVTATVVQAGATASNATATTLAGGAATFSGLTLTGTAGSYTLSFASNGLTAVTSGTITLTAGTANNLTLTTQPSASAQSGVAFAQQPAVQVRDGANNPVSQAGVTVTAAIAAGGGTLGGTLTATTIGTGVASFTNLAISGTAGDRTLSFSAPGLTGVSSTVITITAGAATQLSLTVQPSNTVAGAAITPAVQVTALDGQGNTATGFTGNVTVALGANPGGGTLSGTTTVAAVGGVATFSGLSINKVGTGYTLTASATGTTGTTSAGFTIAPGAASQLVFTVQPSATTAGAAITPAVQVTAQDAQGNTATQFSGNVTVGLGTGGGGGTLSGSTTIVAVGGVATFTNLSIDKVGTGYTLTAGATGLGPATSAAFAITAGAASQLVFTVQPTSTTAGAAITPAVQVTAQDAQGNTATGFTGNVTAAIGTNPSGGTLSGTTTVAAVSGVATFSTLSIDKIGTGYTLSAGASGLPPVSSAPFNIAAGAAARVVFSVQPSNATAGSAITPAVQVTALDGQGNTATAFTGTVTLAIGTNPSGGILSGTTSVAAVSGVATFANLSINKGGSGYTLAASATAVTGATSTAFTITPGAATQLVFTVQPSNTAASASITPAVQVTAEDGFGNTDPTFTGTVTVALGTNPGGGTLSGSATVPAASGVATFTGLSIDKSGVGYTLTAAATGLATGTSATFNIVAGAATHLAFTVQPSNATAGAAITPAVRVTALDAQGNTAVAFTGTVTVAIGTNPGGGTLAGTASVAAVSGVATFSNLSINKVGTGYTLTAAATGPAGATSTPFDVAPGAATHLAFTVPPSTTPANATITPPIQVTALDAGNNVATGFTGNVVMAIPSNSNPGNGTLSGTKTVAAVGGVATFSDLNINNPGTGYRLRATSTGLTAITSALFNITAVTQLVFTVEPGNIAAGGTITPAVGVTAEDAAGRVATGFAGSVTVAIGTNPSGGTLSGTKTVAAVAGVATFGDLSVDKAGTGYTLTAAATGLTSPTSSAFNVSAGGATHLVFAVQPSNATAGTAVAPAVQVTAQDAQGNSDPTFTGNVTVAIGTNPGGGTLSGTTTVAAVNGVAVFATLSINKTGTGYTLAASASGQIGNTSATFNITPGAAADLVFTVEPSSATSGAAITPAVQVTARDAQGNTATSFAGSVTVAIGTNAGGGTLSGTLTQPVAAGVASFANLSIDKTGTGYTLVASSGSLAGATSSGFSIVSGTVSASQSTVVATSPITVGSGTSTLTVTAKDGNGNAIQGATVVLAASGAGNTLTQPTTTTNSSGVATGTLASAVAESKTVSATINSVAITQTATVVVSAASTTTAITTHTPNPSVTGQGVAVAFTVTSNGGTPTGNVTVSDGAATCSGTVAAGTCTLTPTTAGSKTLTATYGGDANFAGSTSAGASPSRLP